MQKRAFTHYLRLLAQPSTCLGVGMLIFIYCALAYLLAADRKAAEADASTRGDNLVRVMRHSLTTIFNGIELNLRDLSHEIQSHDADFTFADWVAIAPTRRENSIEFLILDSKGEVLRSTNPQQQNTNTGAFKDVIAQHQSLEDDALNIGVPFSLGESAKSKFIVSHKITPAVNKNGAYAVAAVVDIAGLARALTELDIGTDGAFAVNGTDRVMRIRVSNGKIDWSNIGRKLPPDNNVAGHTSAASYGAFWNSPGIFDGRSRWITYSTLGHYPLVAIVALSKEEVYRRANENSKIYWIVTLVLTAAVFIGIGYDVKNRRQLIDATEDMQKAQVALLRSEERYRKIEGAVNDGIWDWNIETGEDYLSPRWKAILGYEDHEIPNIKSSFIERVHPDDLAKVTAAAQADIDDNKPYDVEYRLRCKNGEYKWVQSRGRAYQDANGHTSRMLGIMTDISERKRSEETLQEEISRRREAQAALQASEERYRKVEDAVNDGIWDRNLLTDEYYLSPRWKAILGFADDELPDRKDSFYGRIHPDDEAAVVAAVRAHLDGGKPYTIDLRLRCKNGDYVWVQSRGRAEFDDAGKPVRMLGTIKDISERKGVEHALREEARRREEVQAELAMANQNLEERIAARTQELARELRQREEAQMKLAQVQKLEAVGQLTAGIAHDFNNLLSVINGGLEFVNAAAERGLPTDPELIDTAMRATRRGGELVQRLLAFARQAPLKAKAEKVDQLVLDALRLLHRTLGERIEIETCLEAPGALVRVDRNQMINVLVNLALNARDAMPDGGKLIISTSCKGSPWAAQEGSDRWPTGDAVYITVSDTGAGMTEEIRRRAVEPFFTTKPDGVGTGLGLSTVLGFVEQTGGHLEIASQVGMGTQVTVLLPRIEVDNASTETVAADGLTTSGREKLVLLVEDDPDMRVMTAAQLKSLGYRVQVAADGNEAITLMESPIRFDVALTDIVLPGGVDGLALIKEALRSRPSMGLLCMTGYDPGRSHRKWLDVQNISLLEKPFTSTQLANALSDVIVQKAS